MRRLLTQVSLLAVSLAAISECSAHTRSESFSRWKYEPPVLTATFTVSAREATRIPRPGNSASMERVLADYLAERVAVTTSGGDCTGLIAFTPVVAREGFLQAQARWHCQGPPHTIEIGAFLDLAAEHVHFAGYEAGSERLQRMLTAEDSYWILVATPASEVDRQAATHPFVSFLGRGFFHILSGLDHIVFVLALLLICRQRMDVVWAVTGFTLGHSISLVAVTVGLAQPLVPAVEATIGLTIALVAVERVARIRGNALPLAATAALMLLLPGMFATSIPSGFATSVLPGLALFTLCYLLLAHDLSGSGVYRLLATSLFGLIHGLGFAGGFMSANFPGDELPLPLAGFNIGVELGQILLLGLFLAVGALFKRLGTPTALAADIATALVCGVGVFWFVERGFM